MRLGHVRKCALQLECMRESPVDHDEVFVDRVFGTQDRRAGDQRQAQGGDLANLQHVELRGVEQKGEIDDAIEQLADNRIRPERVCRDREFWLLSTQFDQPLLQQDVPQSGAAAHRKLVSRAPCRDLLSGLAPVGEHAFGMPP